MFHRAQQFISKRFASHAHHYGVSPLINNLAYQPNLKAGQAFKKAYEEKIKHSGPVTATWKKITYFIAFPAIVLTAIPVIKIELDHAKHREHESHLTDEEWPVQYPYQNFRTRNFFWGDGDKTLFWNPQVNRHIEDA